MSQSNEPPAILTGNRITDLQAFANLGITKEQLEVYDVWQQIHERQDRQRSARIVLYASLIVLGIGILVLLISIIATALSLTTASFVTSTTVASVDGVFYYGYKQLIQHFYPVLPEKKGKS